MSAAKEYKPAHGGYPGAVDNAPRYYVVYTNEAGEPDGNVAWLDASNFGGVYGRDPNDTHFTSRANAEAYLAYRMDPASACPREEGEFYAITAVK